MVQKLWFPENIIISMKSEDEASMKQYEAPFSVSCHAKVTLLMADPMSVSEFDKPKIEVCFHSVFT